MQPNRPGSFFRLHPFLTFFLVIILLFVTYFYVFNPIKDYFVLKHVSEKVNWVENFYTKNARYPTEEEFKKQYPYFRERGQRQGYVALGPYQDHEAYVAISQFRDIKNKTIDAPQSFILTYLLSKEYEEAPGYPHKSIFGYDGYYIINPCERWNALGFDKAQYEKGIPRDYTKSLTDSPSHPLWVSDGGLFTDFNKGEIYFSPTIGTKDDKVVVLTDLKKPRLFRIRGDRVMLTNGNDVISYNWVEEERELKNPQKIGQVPSGCTVDPNFKTTDSTER